MKHPNEVHGHARRKATRTYYAWTSMRQRCQNPKKENFPRYGGRGITVCDGWGKFSNFLRDMGECPEGMSLGRIDNDGNYCKENCRWETAAQQNSNKSNAFLIAAFGETKTLAAWSRHTGLKEDVLRYRLRKLKWGPEVALTKPLIANGAPEHFRANR